MDLLSTENLFLVTLAGVLVLLLHCRLKAVKLSDMKVKCDININQVELTVISHMHMFLYLLFSKITFYQRTHHRLRGTSGANVWQNKLSMSLLCIADPT